MTLKKLQRAASIAALTIGVFVFGCPGYAQTTREATAEDSIRPFKVQVPQAALDDLRRRVNATRMA